MTSTVWGFHYEIAGLIAAAAVVVAMVIVAFIVVRR